jgi:sodium-dependent dicarboxylate transporter 2/3/5
MPDPSADRPLERAGQEPEPGPRLPVDRIGLVLGPLAAAVWILFVDRGPLSPEAHRLAGIMLLTILWWLTEPIPIPATGLAAVALCVILKAVPANASGKVDAVRTVLAPFADPSVFFLLGGVFIGRAMTRHGLDRRIALAILCTRWAGRSPATVLCAVGLGVATISMWISNTAATAMMYPVTLGIIAVLAVDARGALAGPDATEEGDGVGARGARANGFARSPYASALLMMTAYASSVGGVATPIGTATNVVAIGYFKRPDYFGQGVDFLRWAAVGVPLMVVVFVGLFGWLRLRAPADVLDLASLRQYLRDEQSRLGPWNRGEVNTLIVFLAVVTLWITPGVLKVFASATTHDAFAGRFPEEVVAVLAPVFLFLLPVDWAARRFTMDASDLAKVDWGTILLFGAGLSLGGLMFSTGLAKVVGDGVFRALGVRDVWAITALAIAGGIVLSEFTSNAATAIALIPVVWTLCAEARVDPWPPLLGVTFGASFGSALPVSTPPNAIVYSSGLLPVRRMIAAGVGVDVLAGVAIWIVLRIAFALGWRAFA